MLAQNFKSAADLGITDDEFKAAATVLGMLERGELVHHRCFSENGDFKPTVPNGFDMGCSGESNDCGTVACIGGWMAIVMGCKGGEISSYVNGGLSQGLYKLFWSDIDSNISTQQAAAALRSFLNTGDPNWRAAIAT